MGRIILLPTLLAVIVHGASAGAGALLQEGAAPDIGTIEAGAICVLQPTTLSTVTGVAEWIPSGDGLRFRVRATGAEPETTYGIHVHEFGDVSDRKGMATGEHFNPTGEPHSCPLPRAIAVTGGIHAGDIGNVRSDSAGVINHLQELRRPLSIQSLRRQDLGFIIGRSLVLHADPDDCVSQPSGHSGGRIAQCVIGYRNPTAHAGEV